MDGQSDNPWSYRTALCPQPEHDGDDRDEHGDHPDVPGQDVDENGGTLICLFI